MFAREKSLPLLMRQKVPKSWDISLVSARALLESTEDAGRSPTEVQGQCFVASEARRHGSCRQLTSIDSGCSSGRDRADAVTAFNRGHRATTITNLGMLFYKNRWSKLRNKADQAFIITSPSDAQRLPFRFEAGDQWIGMANQDDKVLAMAKYGLLYAVVYHSHSGKGIRIRLLPNEPKPQQPG